MSSGAGLQNHHQVSWRLQAYPAGHLRAAASVPPWFRPPQGAKGSAVAGMHDHRADWMQTGIVPGVQATCCPVHAAWHVLGQPLRMHRT